MKKLRHVGVVGIILGVLLAFSGLTVASATVASAATVSPGYWLVAGDGGGFTLGGAGVHGSPGGIVFARQIAGMASTPDGNGYWLAAADGDVLSFGSAGFYGSL